MKRQNSGWQSRGFTLVELLVVIAIIGVLVALLLPAVQAAREAARRSSCVNNTKNLALACLNYEATNKILPRGRKFDYWDTYTWTEYVLPFIEQQTVYDLYWTLPDKTWQASNGTAVTTNGPIGDDARLRQARHTPIPPFYCPSDQTPLPNELDSAAFGMYRGNYRGCVGGSDMYGNRIDSTSYVPFPQPGDLLGSFGVKKDTSDPQRLVRGVKLSDLSDGTTNTLLISEGVAPTIPDWGGPIGSLLYGNMGGGLFSAFEPPNTSEPDSIYGRCPRGHGDFEYEPPCKSINENAQPGQPGAATARAYARSYHPGGVNAAMSDGSVTFASDDVETAVWRAMGTGKYGDSSSR